MTGPDLSGEIVDRRYQIVERIASGAMGVVYRGVRLKLDRAVAIKVMHSSLPGAMEGRKRFDREAKVMARLEHPHCVSIIDYGIHGDKPFVVMELVRGRSLFEILVEHGRFELPRAVDVVCQVLSGLAHAHDQGIIHRDIKPANIMITPKAPLGVHARILDFGLARLLGGSHSLSNGVAVGTPSYMAPEQCRGDAVDARTDIYACGVVLFEMLTGKKPFIASDPIAIVKKHLEEMPPLLAEVKPDNYGPLEGIVARALAKSPADRYASAVAMAEALDAALTGRSNAAEATAALPLLGSSELKPLDPSVEIPITVGSSARVPPALKREREPRDHDEPSAPALPSAEPDETNSRTTPLIRSDEASSKSDEPSVPTARVSKSDEASITTPRPRPEPSETRSAVRRLLPVSRMRYVVIAAILLTVAAAVGVIAARVGGDETARPDARREPVVAPSSAVAAPDPVDELLASATQLASTGKLEPAIDMLLKARKRYPERAELAVQLGKLYFAKMWWNDGLANLRDAVKLDPALKDDPELQKLVLRAFITTPGYDDRLGRFIVELGPAMKPLLEETARSHPKPEIRARTTAVLRRIH